MGENKCWCGSDFYENNLECILHCNKEKFSDNQLYPMYDAFKKALKKLVVDNGFLILEKVNFPFQESNNSDEYDSILRSTSSIQFLECTFYLSHLDLEKENSKKVKCFFKDCIFINNWILYDYGLDNTNKSIYEHCTFEKNIENYVPESSKTTQKYRHDSLSYSKDYMPIQERVDAEIYHQAKEAQFSASLFDSSCTFNENITFRNVKFKEELFIKSSSTISRRYIKDIVLENCIFDRPFILNKTTITNQFICKDTTFVKKSKFEFKENKVEKFELGNTNFKVLVDCFNTKFQSFKVEKSIFEKFTGFEKCRFGEKENNSKESIFQYATFLDFVNFRDAEFHDGLDLRNTNFKETPNFLDVKIEPNNKSKKTNRETFRIIKHSFDSVGNTIEANKFFAYEMNEEKKESKGFKKLMLNLNYLISDFGQSWIRPLLFIIYFLILQYLVFCLIDNWQIPSKSLQTIWVELNHTIHNFMPFKKFLVEGKEFVSLFFLIIYSTLIYNLIIAVKRITKR